jgi:hypothetical protein
VGRRSVAVEFETQAMGGERLGDSGAEEPCSGCREVCLHVVVRVSDSVPVVSKAKVKEIVDEVNKLWGCPGQCCIRFRLDGDPLESRDLPYSVEWEEKKQDATHWSLNKLLAEAKWRDADCYNLYFVNAVRHGGLGVTKYKPDAGSVVSARDKGGDDRSTADLGVTVSHELGHALGLARDSDNEDPNGVTGHSTKPDNVMGSGFNKATNKAVAQSKLNSKQCQEARKSPLAKVTKVKCECSPKEALT